MQIAIDTSTDTASLALVQESGVIAELTWRCVQNHTIQLLPNLAHLLKQNNLSLKTADCIIVARGPGSYNGLRVGISTLEAEAYQYAPTGLPVCPVFNAGREEIATATYQQKTGQWRQIAEERLTTVEALCDKIITKTVFCGEFVPAVAEKLKDNLKQKAVIVPGLRRAGFLAELGLKRFKAGDYDDAATLQALYFRGPSISQPKHR